MLHDTICYKFYITYLCDTLSFLQKAAIVVVYLWTKELMEYGKNTLSKWTNVCHFAV